VKHNESNSLNSSIVFILFIGLAFYEGTKNIKWQKKLNDFIIFSHKAIFYIVIILSISLLILFVYRYIKVRKTKEKGFIE